VSRLVCKSENYEMDMTLDVNVELLPVEKEFKFNVELATTLNLDGTPDSGCYEQGQEKSADNRLSGCDYAMHGKVFKYDNMSDNKVYAALCALRRASSVASPAASRALCSCAVLCTSRLGGF
jgi:DNA-directed RNA polymerase I, II, and III subunit RPABC3